MVLFLPFHSPLWRYILVTIHVIHNILCSPVGGIGRSSTCAPPVSGAKGIRNSLAYYFAHDLTGTWFPLGGISGVEVLTLGPSVGMG